MPDYPPYVASAEQRERWDAAQGIAEVVMGEGASDEAIWAATRAIYTSPAPT